ncbi:MAG: hypothetical protein HYX68_02660 [Planctomycetes bacterium]|nr:hypothetical protein [Planctomycetota bacterium]
MPRDDDHFWLDIFKKSPLIATFMAIGGILGCGAGVYFFGDLGRLPNLRLVACLIFSATCAGIFVGLIVGVIVDSLIGSVRGDDDKKRRKNRGKHR